MDDLNIPDFDDSDFDFDGGFDMGYVERPPAADTREAIEYTIRDTGSSLFDGLVNAPTDSIQEIISASMPDELSKETQGITDLHNTLKNEVDSVRAEVVQKSATTLRAIEKILPQSEVVSNIKEGILNFIGADAEENTDRGPTEQERLTSRINGDIEKALGAKQEASQKEDILNKTIESRRHFESSKLLSIIATHTESNDNFNTEISNVYYRKSLELQYRQLEANKELVSVTKTAFELFRVQNEAVIKNTGLPDIVKIRSTEAVKANMMNRAISGMGDALLKNNSWVDNVKEKGMNALGNLKDMMADKFDMANDMMDMSSDLGGEDGPTPGDMAGGMVADFIKGKAGDAIATLLGKNQSAAEGFVELKNMFLNPSGTFADMASESDNPILKRMYSTISQVTEAGVTSEGTILDRSDPDQPMFFDVRTHTTLNKVIPSYLSKMHGTLLSILHKDTDPEGNEEKYDYDMDKFYTKSERKDRIKSTLRQKVSKSVISQLEKVQEILSEHGLILDGNAEVGMFRKGVMTYLLNGGNTSPGAMLKNKFLNNFPDELRTKVENSVLNLIDEAKTPGKSKLIDDMNEAMLGVQTSDLGVEKNIKSAQRDGNIADYEDMGIVKTDKITGTSIIDHEAYKKLITDEIVKQTQMDTNVEETLDDERRRRRASRTLEMIATGDDVTDRQSTIGMLTDRAVNSVARGAANVTTSETIKSGVSKLRTTLDTVVTYANNQYQEHLTDEQKAAVAKNIKVVTDYYKETLKYSKEKVLRGKALIDTLLENKINIESLPESVQVRIRTFKETTAFKRTQEYINNIKNDEHFKILETKLKDGTATVEDSELYKNLIQKMEERKNLLVALSETTIGQIKNNIKLWSLNVKKTYDEQVLHNLSKGNSIDKQVDKLSAKGKGMAKALGIRKENTGEGLNILRGQTTNNLNIIPSGQMKWGVTKPRVSSQEAIDKAQDRLNITNQSIEDTTNDKNELSKKENLLDVAKEGLSELKNNTTEAIDNGITTAVDRIRGKKSDDTTNNSKLYGPGFFKGGYTGDGEKLTEAGIVHKAELVINKADLEDLVNIHSKGDTVETSNFLSELLSSVKKGTDVEAIKEQIEKGDKKLNWLQSVTSKVDTALSKKDVKENIETDTSDEDNNFFTSIMKKINSDKVDNTSDTDNDDKPPQGIALNFIGDEDAIKQHHLDYLHFRENNDTTLDFETYLADLGLTQYKSKVTGDDRPSRSDILGRISMFSAIQQEGAVEWGKNRIIEKMKKAANIGDTTIELTADQVKDMEDTYLDSKAYREGIVKNFDEYLIAMNYRRPMNFWQKWGNRFKKTRAFERKMFGGALKGIWSGTKAIGGILPKAVKGAGKGIINSGSTMLGMGKILGDVSIPETIQTDTRSLAKKAVDGSISGMGKLVTGLGKGSWNAIKGLSGYDEYKYNSNVNRNSEIRERYLESVNNDVISEKNRLNSSTGLDLFRENITGKKKDKDKPKTVEEIASEISDNEKELEHIKDVSKVRDHEVTSEAVANEYVKKDKVNSIIGLVPKGKSENYNMEIPEKKENKLEESIEKLTLSIVANTEINKPEEKRRVGNVFDAMKEDAEQKKNKKRNGQKDPTKPSSGKDNKDSKESPGGAIGWLGGVFTTALATLSTTLLGGLKSVGSSIWKATGGKAVDYVKDKAGALWNWTKKIGNKVWKATGGKVLKGLKEFAGKTLGYAKNIGKKMVALLPKFKVKVLSRVGKVGGAKIIGKLSAKLIPGLGWALLAYDVGKVIHYMVSDGMDLKGAVSMQLLGFNLFDDDEPVKDEDGNLIPPDSGDNTVGTEDTNNTENNEVNKKVPEDKISQITTSKNVDESTTYSLDRIAKSKNNIDDIKDRIKLSPVQKAVTTKIIRVPRKTPLTNTKVSDELNKQRMYVSKKIIRVPRSAPVPVANDSHIPIELDDELNKQREHIVKKVVSVPTPTNDIMPSFDGVENLIATSNVHLSSIDSTLKQILTHMKDNTNVKVVEEKSKEPVKEKENVHIQKSYVEPQVTIHRNEYL